MKKLIAIALSFWVFSAAAQELVEFENGQVANADEINANFQALHNEVTELRELLSTFLTELQFDVTLDGEIEGEVLLTADELEASVVIGQSGAAKTVQAISSGKHYFEVTMGCNDNRGVWVVLARPDTPIVTAENTEWYGFTTDLLRHQYYSGSWAPEYFSLGPQTTVFGDVFRVAADLDLGHLFFGKNDVWLDSSPTEGVPLYQNLAGEFVAGVGMASEQCDVRTAKFNFGASDFAYDVPSGYFKGYCPTNDCEIAE